MFNFFGQLLQVSKRFILNILNINVSMTTIYPYHKIIYVYSFIVFDLDKMEIEVSHRFAFNFRQ